MDASSDSLKVGLVLSGGGALGIAHIGVIQAIEEAGIRIDYITGTSIGSLVGGLYSIGYTTDQLVEIVRSNNFVELFSEKPERRYVSNYEKITNERSIAQFPINEKGINLPPGIITGQNVYSFITKLTWNVHGTENFNQFPIPFAAVATNLETGEPRVFHRGYLPDALRASISIPSIFNPHQIEDEYYVDGGLVRNLPVQDAIEMGAEYTIAVDVSSPLMPKDSLNSLTEILNQSALFSVRKNEEEQKKLADLIVEVEELVPYSAADFDLAEEILEVGQNAGEKYLQEFKKVAEMQKYPPKNRRGVGQSGSLPINEIVLEGNTIYDDDFIMERLDFEPGASLSPETIEEKVSRLYSSRYINSVNYRIVPDENYFYKLHIRIEESTSDEFKVGLRYESSTQASIFMEADFLNLFNEGSLTRFEARLGDRINFQADHLYFGALGSSFALMTQFQYQSESIDWFLDEERVSRFKNEVFRGELSGGNYFGTQNLLAIGIRKDITVHSNRINPDQIEPSDQNYHSIFARFIRDRFDRRAYPTKGHKLIVESYYSDDLFLSDLNFSSTTGYYLGYYPLDEYVTFKHSLWAGYTTGRELPWEYWKAPNRFEPVYHFIRFGGLERYEKSSRNVQMATAGFQIEPLYHRFIEIDLYAARYLKRWDFNASMDEINWGGSISFGALTILGPVKVIFSSSTLQNFKTEIQIGYHF